MKFKVFSIDDGLAYQNATAHHKSVEQLEHPALNDFEQTSLWESLIGAETRSQYFAVLVQHLRSRHRFLTIGSLVLSSGAALTLIGSFPTPTWVKALLALASAVLSAISLVSSNEKSAIEAADLSFRWQTLAASYEDLWAHMYASDAHMTFQKLREEEARISKSSTALPNLVRLMASAEENVMMHHQSQLPA